MVSISREVNQKITKTLPYRYFFGNRGEKASGGHPTVRLGVTRRWSYFWATDGIFSKFRDANTVRREMVDKTTKQV
jgi:hypothetical protein